MRLQAQRPAHPALVIVVTAAVGVAITTAVVVARLTPALGDDRHTLGVVTLDDLHEGQLEAAAAMVLTFIAAVLWGRVRRLPTRRHLMLFTAFCMLALDNVMSGMFTAGFDSLSTNRFATWSTTANGLMGAVLLVFAAWLPDVPLQRPRTALLRTLVAVTAVLAAATLSIWQLRDTLPGAFATRPETADQVTLFGDHPSLYLIEALAAGCWAVAAVFFTQLTKRAQDELTWWLALGSMLAAVSFANYSLFPSHFTELLYLGDYFFLAAVIALLIGAVREIGAAEAALVDRSLYDERRRLAREMHDGVAQELAIMSAQAHRIRSHPETADIGLRRIQESVDRAMDEARTAIKQLSGPVDSSVAAAIGDAAESITARGDARLTLDLDDSLVVSPEVRLALVHVTQDAVAAAVRGAGADTVRIDLRRTDVTTLRITDDGRHTDTLLMSGETTMNSIREQLARVSGDVVVHARPDGGVTVEVTVP
ncbi:MAG: histidine kinase [Actinomycetota bacterium]|nr:histidine kinase [Actinomycetota bacterium]